MYPRKAGATRPRGCREEDPSLCCSLGEEQSTWKRGSPDGTVRGRRAALRTWQSRAEPWARPERAGCEHRRILGGPVGRLRKSGRAGGRLRRPFPVRMGIMSKQNRSARSEQKTTRSHPRLPDPRREVFGVFPSISRRPGAGGHRLQMGCGTEPQKLSGARKGGSHPQPSPGAGGHLQPRCGGGRREIGRAHV